MSALSRTEESPMTYYVRVVLVALFLTMSSTSARGSSALGDTECLLMWSFTSLCSDLGRMMGSNEAKCAKLGEEIKNDPRMAKFRENPSSAYFLSTMTEICSLACRSPLPNLSYPGFKIMFCSEP